MKTKVLLTKVIVLVCLVFYCSIVKAQGLDSSTIKLGAYYFDGWTGEKLHLTNSLSHKFPERMPIWGWVTSTPAIMAKQIDLAANSGLSYFCFCWYYPDSQHPDKKDPLNQALSLFLKARNRDRLNFNILVVNQGKYAIGPDEWDDMSSIWIKLMKMPTYLKANGKPLLLFYDVDKLIEKFGTLQGLQQALLQLRARANAEGIPAITIGACIDPNLKKMQIAEQCGFEVFTAYNFLTNAMKKGDSTTPIDSLIAKEPSIWNKFLKSNVQMIPVSTLNFDGRPWSAMNDFYRSSGRYVGYSAESVYKSVKSLKTWSLQNQGHLTQEKLAVVYAWNENGEGAWLTPSKTFHPLLGLKKAMK